MSIAAVGTQVDPDRCPYCDSIISKTRFNQVRAKIAEQERAQLAGEKDRMRKELQAREAAIRKDAEARANAEAEKRVAGLVAERQRDTAKIKQLEVAKQQHQKELAELRAKVEKDFGVQLEAAKRQHQKDIEQARTALTKDRDDQLLKLHAQQNRERDQLQVKIDGLKRQLQRKTADELGEGAEVDVYESLRDSFPDDQIRRIKRGMPGADIRHVVLYKGTACGTIVIDSKNRLAWQNTYVTKLREDQVTDRADHAIVATTVFPSGTKELCVDRDTQVIIVNRARVVEIVGLLRSALVRAHTQGLSLTQRAEKRELLYSYLASEGYRQRMNEAERLAGEVLELDVEEKRTHEKVWEKRGKMETRLRNAIREIDTEISAVLEGRSPTGSGS